MAKAVHFPRVKPLQFLHHVLIFSHVNGAQFSTTSPAPAATLTEPGPPISHSRADVTSRAPGGRTRPFAAARQVRSDRLKQATGSEFSFAVTAGETQAGSRDDDKTRRQTRRMQKIKESRI